MTAVLDVTISTESTATVAGEAVVKGRHRTINDAAMDRCKEIARARRERVAVRAKAANGREHWVWAYSDGKVSRMEEAEIRAAERAIPRAAPAKSTHVDLDEPEPPVITPSGGGTFMIPSGSIGLDPDIQLHVGPDPDAPRVASPVGSFGVIGTSAFSAPKVISADRVLPTFEDVLEEAEQPRDVATSGWRALLKLPPGRAERERRADQETIKRSDLDGPRTVVVVNVKGGVGKTTTTRQLAAAIGSAKGGYTIAIDANPSRGNLANRCKPADHKKTVIDLVDDIERFQRADARVGELATYVRSQDELFDVLSSDQDTERMQTLGRGEFAALDAVTDKFYRIKVVDTGNDF